MKYLIKVTDKALALLTIADAAELPEGFEEVTKIKYHLLIKAMDKHPHGRYKGGNWAPEKKINKEAREANREARKEERRIAKELKIDLEFIERYDRLKAAGKIN